MPPVEAVGAEPRFVGIGVDTYEHFDALDAVAPVTRMGELLRERGFGVRTFADVTDAQAEEVLADALASGTLAGGALVVLWAGHAERTPTNELRLITTRARPGAPETRTARQLVQFAMATRAEQILVVLDTCFAAAALPSASDVVNALREAFPEPNGWVGILTSARPFERARDGTFAQQLERVLRHGPDDPALRLRFNAFNEGVRGDDVINAVLAEWPAEHRSQRPDGQGWGLPRVMFPNPRFDPEAAEEVVEHLLLAAQGRAADEAGTFFTGRQGPLQRIVDWMARPGTGVLVMTGPPGCGKSAVAGRIVSLSAAATRAAIAAEGDLGPDPGEGSVHAHVHARRLTVDEVAGTIDAQLQAKGLLPRAERRNANALLGAVQTQTEAGSIDAPLTVVVDGLDEADAEAPKIADDLLRRLARYAKVLVATRRIRTGEGTDLGEALGTEPILDLGDPEWATETEDDVSTYVARRLSDVPGTDATAVGAHVLRLTASEGEGAFLLARVVTSQLREQPVDTSVDGWIEQMATSVEAAIDRDLARVPGAAPSGVEGPSAARHLLAALAWGFGNGLPDDVWAVVANALAGDQADYTRDDVYWLLGVAGRYVVTARGGDTAVYRLAHQRLAHHLRPPRPFDRQREHDPGTRPVAEAVVATYRTLLDTGVPATVPRYFWLHTWQHCGEAGEVGLGLLRSLAADHPVFRPDLALALVATGGALHLSGRSELALGPTEEAVAVLREVVAGDATARGTLAGALVALGVFLNELGRPGDAAAPTEEAVAVLRELATENPAVREPLSNALSNLGMYLQQTERVASALTYTDEAVSIGRALAEEGSDTGIGLPMSLINQGLQRSDRYGPAEGIEPTREAVEMLRGPAASDVGARRLLARGLNNLLGFLSMTGRYEEALVVAAEAIGLLRELRSAPPGADADLALPGHEDDLAMALANHGSVLAELGRHREALAPLREAIALLDVATAGNPERHATLSLALVNLGRSLAALGDTSGARPPTERAIELLRPLASGNRAHLGRLSLALSNLGMFLATLGHSDEAVAVLEEAVTVLRRLSDGSPAFAANLAMAHINLGRAEGDRGRVAAGLTATDEAIAIVRAIPAPTALQRSYLAMALANRSLFLAALGQARAAVPPAAEAVEVLQPLAAQNRAHLAGLASALAGHGRALAEVGDHTGALDRLDAATAAYRALGEEARAHDVAFATALTNRADVLTALGRPAAAEAPAAEAAELLRPHPGAGVRAARAAALATLADVRIEQGRWSDAHEPAREAVEIQRDLAAQDQTDVAAVATALARLGRVLAAEGRSGDVDDAWSAAAAALPPEGAAELHVRRAGHLPSLPDAVAALASACDSAERRGGGRPLGVAHDTARGRRREDPGAFDAAWAAATGSIPGWLTLPPDDVALVQEWRATPTYEAEWVHARTHASRLLGGPTELVLHESALLANDPSTLDRYVALLRDARQRGFDAAYEDLVAGERLRRYLDLPPVGQVDRLRAARQDLVSPASLAALDRMAPDGADLGFGAALLRLAQAGLDARLLELPDDPGAVEGLVVDVLGGHPPSLWLELGRALAHGGTTAPTIALGCVAAACALVVQGPAGLEEATPLVAEARRRDDATVRGFLPHLAVMIATYPSLASLVGAITAPLPDPQEA